MVVSRDNPFASRASRAVLAITAAAGLCAAVAATPSASIGKENGVAASANLTGAGAAAGEPAKGIRPLGRGPTIRVGRAFDAEDEDCTLAVTKVPAQGGGVHVARSLTCVN